MEAASPSSALPSDLLAIPKMNFDITRRYTELQGLQLIPTAPGMADDLQVVAADQNTRFLMDEEGVELRSESTMSFGCSAESPHVPQHQLIFDKPFLLLLSHGRSKSPYFVLWIGNTELLVTTQ